ncbi:MAG TPA: S-adenosylmethionine:tRNA ribosyltransferase-isomerase, partial [Patescibacteria group bacterium]
MLTLDQFDYHLPKDRIAHQPAVPRDTSRLLVVDRQTGNLQHHHFYDLPSLLTANDVIVRNNTKVIPARLYGQKTSGGEVEILLIKRVSQTATGEVWECLTKPGLKEDQEIRFRNYELSATCVGVTGYTRLIEFNKFGQDLFS